MTNLSSKDLRRAADVKDEIAALQVKLEAILNPQPPVFHRGLIKVVKRRWVKAKAAGRNAL